MNVKTYTNFDIFFKFIIVLIFIYAFIISVSAYDITYDDMEAICYIRNLSFFDCYDLMVELHNLNQTQECEEIETIINQTCEAVNETKICSEYLAVKQMENEHELAVLQVTAGCTPPKDLLSQSECNIMVNEAERKVADECRADMDKKSEEEEGDSPTREWWFVPLLILLVIIVLIFIARKSILNSLNQPSQRQPQNDLSDLQEKLLREKIQVEEEKNRIARAKKNLIDERDKLKIKEKSREDDLDGENSTNTSDSI